jgi:uncharacterized protein (DUF2225 family)
VNAETQPDLGQTTTAKPLVRCSVVCPLCGVIGVQYRLNPRLYWYNGRDIDLQPRDYRCRKGMEGIHPPLFALWHCTNCRFTAEHTCYTTPLKDILIRADTVASRLNEAVRSDGHYRTVCEVLSGRVVLDAPDFFQAIRLHLLAIAVWDQIGEMVRQDYSTQARYSLLLAWIYRDMAVLDPQREQTAARLTGLKAILAEHGPTLPMTEEEALRKAAACYEASLDISNFVKDAVHEATALNRLARIQIKLGELRAAYETLRRGTVSARAAITGIRRQLTSDAGRTPGAEREKLVEQDRRLEALLEDEGRLAEMIRGRMNQQAA